MENVGLYNVNDMPLSEDETLRCIQNKILSGEELSISEKRKAGRDHPVKVIDGYELKPDCVYRCVSKELYEKYLEAGFIFGDNEDDEYEIGNNKGVNWYLGGTCPKYGEVIIECPATKEYFIPAYDSGCHLSYDPKVRHMKSSGYKNPVPVSLIRIIKHPNFTFEELTDEISREK